MGKDIFVWGATDVQVFRYYVFVFISFLYLLNRYKSQSFSLYIILLFYNGLMTYISKDIGNIYKITITLLSIYWLIKTKSFQFVKRYTYILLSFLLFSFTFFYTVYKNDDYFFIIFSQYSRFFLLFSLIFIMLKFRYDEILKFSIGKVLYDILLIQILLSVAKFFIMGPRESLVGSVASQGGAVATSLPILGFMFIWLRKKGVLNRKDWLFIIGLIFIGFMSYKRAIWFIMPLVIAAFMFYISKRKIPTRIILFAVLAVPLVFYFGVRLNPTLNKEKTNWGSFDLNYAFNFAEDYNFGSGKNQMPAQGRGGATLFVFNKAINGGLKEKDWFGYGLRFMYATDYEEFDKLDLGINHKGSATGLFQTMVTNGYLGIITLILLIVSIIIQTRNKRLRYVLMGFVFWEYFFYTGIVLREYALTFLLVYIISFSDFKIVVKNLIPKSNKLIMVNS